LLDYSPWFFVFAGQKQEGVLQLDGDMVKTTVARPSDHSPNFLLRDFRLSASAHEPSAEMQTARLSSRSRTNAFHSGDVKP
jgi:hypothetical protein